MPGSSMPQIKAARLLMRFGSIDGDHHKAWCIDQALRILLGESGYLRFRLERARDGYGWDEGIAP